MVAPDGLIEHEGEPKTFEEACQVMAETIADLVISKQHDYGHENILAFGEFGILVRTNDKVARLKNLINADHPRCEAKLDSWQDIAGYALIALMLNKGWFTLPLRGREPYSRRGS